MGNHEIPESKSESEEDVLSGSGGVAYHPYILVLLLDAFKGYDSLTVTWKPCTVFCDGKREYPAQSDSGYGWQPEHS